MQVLYVNNNDGGGAHDPFEPRLLLRLPSPKTDPLRLVPSTCW